VDIVLVVVPLTAAMRSPHGNSYLSLFYQSWGLFLSQHIRRGEVKVQGIPPIFISSLQVCHISWELM